MNNIELASRVLTIATAVTLASSFPGLTIEATAQEWTFDIRHIDSNFDRYLVPLSDLVVEVGCVVDELKGRYGEDAKGLDDLVLDITINASPIK